MTHIALNSRVVSRLLRLQMYYVINVVPQIVVLGDVSQEATLAFLVKGKPLEVANEATVVLVGFHGVLLFSELRECVNDNTEQYVVENNLHDQEEGDVDDQLDAEFLRFVLIVDLLSVVTDTSTKDKTQVNNSHVALNHRGASEFTHLVRVNVVDAVIVDSLHHVIEHDRGVQVNHDQHQHEGHQKLLPVTSNRFRYVS